MVSESIKIREKSTRPVSAKEEYAKNPKLKKSDIEQLDEWVKSQSHLPPDITGSCDYVYDMNIPPA